MDIRKMHASWKNIHMIKVGDGVGGTTSKALYYNIFIMEGVKKSKIRYLM